MNCSRRSFLKILGLTGASAFLLDGPLFAENLAPNPSSLRSYGILNDSTRCVGCHSCENACRDFNGLPPLEKGSDDKAVYPTKLDQNTFTRIESRTIESEAPEGGKITLYRRHMCNHCEHPSCASACPVGALVKSPEGPVYYRPERCIGCRYCINACPFSIPKYQWDSPKPFVRKCTMCYEKVRKGEPTSCAAICPTGATMFGIREELIEDAHKRIALNPERYQDYVFGEHEVGGTNVMYLTSSAIPFSEFGFPMEVGTVSYPNLTWAALSRVPGLALYVVFWVSIVYFITQRRIPEEIKASNGTNGNGGGNH